jgi:hypothetical protein
MQAHHKATVHTAYVRSRTGITVKEASMPAHPADAVPAAQNGAQVPQNGKGTVGPDLLAVLTDVANVLPARADPGFGSHGDVDVVGDGRRRLNGYAHACITTRADGSIRG